MFENIGGKIKTLAKVICWIGIILSLLVGVALIVTGLVAGGTNGITAVVYGVLIAVMGSFLSWIGAFVTYGFGEIVDNTRKIAGE